MRTQVLSEVARLPLVLLIAVLPYAATGQVRKMPTPALLLAVLLITFPLDRIPSPRFPDAVQSTTNAE